jgi:dimethylamine corrinoid protein
LHQDILNRLALSVRNMDEDAAVAAAKDALVHKIDAIVAIRQGLVAGMNEAGRLYEDGEYFVPELLLCSDAMYACLEVLKPSIPCASRQGKAKMVIGVVEGDVHDIGKNLVILMCEVAGFEVHDLGIDVSPAAFISKVREVDADMVCLSTLMSTTMDGMADVIKLLIRDGLREKVTVMVGGGPVSQSFADSIGADGYAENAVRAARLAEKLWHEGGKAGSRRYTIEGAPGAKS